MEFYTEAGAQDLADHRGRPVCAWIPCVAGQPIAGLGDHKWVVDPSGKISYYDRSGGSHSIRRVFRPTDTTRRKSK